MLRRINLSELFLCVDSGDTQNFDPYPDSEETEPVVLEEKDRKEFDSFEDF